AERVAIGCGRVAPAKAGVHFVFQLGPRPAPGRRVNSVLQFFEGNMIRTLIDALSSLPRGNARGFRFITARGEERYYPYEALEREARRRAAKLAALGLVKGDRIALV